MQAAPPPVVTQELRIIDPEGNDRIVMSAAGGAPQIKMMRPDGHDGLAITLDGAGRASISLANPLATGPKAALEVDDKGAHVKFDREGGASSYLFLNNEGASGVVLIDSQGVRRLNITLDAAGTVAITRFDAQGRALP